MKLWAVRTANLAALSERSERHVVCWVPGSKPFLSSVPALKNPAFSSMPTMPSFNRELIIMTAM